MLPGDKKEEMIKDKTLSLDAQLAAVQAHIEDLEVPVIVVITLITVVKTIGNLKKGTLKIYVQIAENIV